MKKYAVIVAAGTGARMGSPIPKQFLELNGKALLWHTLSTFMKAYDDLEIILVIADGQMQTANNIIRGTPHPERVIVATGGETRFHSVKKGLELVSNRSIVFIHDGVRCLVSKNLIHRCYETALASGNAIPAIEAIDSVRLETTEGSKALDRKLVKLIQTPQTFQSDIIKAAFEQEFDPLFTDEATLAERHGIRIHLITGEPTNIKVTTPIDLALAAKILEENNTSA